MESRGQDFRAATYRLNWQERLRIPHNSDTHPEGAAMPYSTVWLDKKRRGWQGQRGKESQRTLGQLCLPISQDPHLEANRPPPSSIAACSSPKGQWTTRVRGHCVLNKQSCLFSAPAWHQLSCRRSSTSSSLPNRHDIPAWTAWPLPPPSAVLAARSTDETMQRSMIHVSNKHDCNRNYSKVLQCHLPVRSNRSQKQRFPGG